MRGRVINFNSRTRTDEVSITFPGGEVIVTRRTDGEGYWAHIIRDRYSRTGEPDAVVTDRRVDCEQQHTSSTDVGDMARPDFYHVAVCIKPGGKR